MKEEQDYIRDIAEIRSMMERSSKFLSLSGLAGVMAGIYALIGAYIAYKVYGFESSMNLYEDSSLQADSSSLSNIIFLAIAILVLAISTAIFLSYKEANKRREKIWTTTSKRMLLQMAVPLFVGGLLILIMLNQGMISFLAPLSLIFYGLALYNAGNFTYREMRALGLIQAGLGLFCSYFPSYGLLCWVLGFGLLHIIYGLYMHYKYTK